MKKKVITKWEPDSFDLETTSLWSFPVRGSWATHDNKWRGNWSPYIPRNIILRYSQEGDLVLDQFAGGGTTLVEAKLLNRNIIGIDVNDAALIRCQEKTTFSHEGANGRVFLKKGDARRLDYILSESIDLICTHPPYASAIQYSDDIPEDLSHYGVFEFLDAMKDVATECYRVLKPGCFCAILMGDLRKSGCVFPLGFEIMSTFRSAGFQTKEIIIKEQHNCRASAHWRGIGKKQNFLLLAHEYLFVFRK